MTTYYGKYRGKVTDNTDPMVSGRVQVSVPGVLGTATAWAMPCTPFAGSGVGFYAIPPVGADVWVEFEGGNPEAPIWAGGFWQIGDLDPTAAVPQNAFLKTSTATLMLSDLPGPLGGITISTNDGKKITVNALGIEITDGTWSIKVSPASVSINDGALEVT